jgi:Tol biopolymer transport system component
MRWFALLTLIVLLAVGCGGSKAQEVKATGSIAFIRDGQLWVMKADGTGQRALTRDRAEKASPAWSPDGRKVAYAYDGGEVIRNAGTPQESAAYPSHIFVINADGSRVQRLTRWERYTYEQKSSPEWSPDGRTVAFHVYDDGDHWIFSVGADGSGQRKLTPPPPPPRFGLADDDAYAWSPDGRKIAFTHINEVGVYVMNRNGSGRHLLARIGAADRARDSAFRTRHVAWSPDGRRIACISDGVLWVMNADGTRPRRLITDPVDNSSSEAATLAWSPDGRKIAFTQRDGKEWEIFVVNGDGSELHKLTDASGEYDVDPVWSPDGRSIAFHSDREGNSEIYVMNADGSGEQNVSESPLDDFSPAWSPKD